ncbi:uncharacterized protein FA14DRAFT_153173 [Meira miltonrushii]|uniref:Uncharacterized protein n=1 Tax=Meira miltonrushii TaxID=1280837 RepID=A0A316VL71_9BASI|nr:uncharacterized protein FA14DRAFT_153173 [Meira miltonrushii]PWN37818.1 hypothetical protein FA14DRAFT_153173 [Meira miltonrushii]
MVPCKRTLTVESIQCLAIDERKEEGENAGVEIFCRFLVNTSVLDPRSHMRMDPKSGPDSGKNSEDFSTHFITRSLDDVLVLSNRLMTTFDVLLSRSRGGPLPLTRKSVSLPRSSRKSSSKSNNTNNPSFARQFLDTILSRQTPSNDAIANRERSNSKSSIVWDAKDHLETQQDRLSKSRKKAIDEFFQTALRIGGEVVASSRAMQDFFLKRKDSNQSNRSLYPPSTISSSIADGDRSQTATLTSRLSFEEDEYGYDDDDDEKSICESTTSSNDGRSCRFAVSNSHMALLHAENLNDVVEKNRKESYKEDDEIEVVGEEGKQSETDTKSNLNTIRRPSFFNIKINKRTKTANGERENDFFGKKGLRRCSSSISHKSSLSDNGSSIIAKSRSGSQVSGNLPNFSAEHLIVPRPRVSSLQQSSGIPTIAAQPSKITSEVLLQVSTKDRVQLPINNHLPDDLSPTLPDESKYSQGEWSSQDSCVDPICAPSPSPNKKKGFF